MAFDFHAIMQDTTNADQVRPGQPIKQKMPGLAHRAVGCPSRVPTMAQVVTAHGEPELRSCHALGALRIKCDVSQTNHQQRLVAPPRDLAELVLGVGEEPDDVLFGGCRKPVNQHGYWPAARTRLLACLPRPATTPLSSSSCRSR